MSTELIIELWHEIKPLINPKERSIAADRLVSLFDDFGCSDGIELEVGLDKDLQEAIIERFELGENEDDEHEHSDW